MELHSNRELTSACNKAGEEPLHCHGEGNIFGFAQKNQEHGEALWMPC